MRPDRGLTNARALDGSWEEPESDAVDTSVHVLSVHRDGLVGSRLAGFVAYYSCHPVVCCEETSAIHGDFPAEALRIVESRLQGVTGVFLQGALGDINPLYAHDPHDESLTALDLFATRLANSILSGIERGVTMPVHAIASAKSTVPYDLDTVDVSALRARRDQAVRLIHETPPHVESREKSMSAIVASSLDRTLGLLERDREIRRPIIVQLLVLGPLTLVAFNLEIFHGIKRRIRAGIGSSCLVLSTTNGYLGYAPTRDAYVPPSDPYPAYEMPIVLCHLPFEPTIDDRLVEAAVNVHALMSSPNPEYSASSQGTN